MRRRVGGQARKSLWIETLDAVLHILQEAVRLVRACGSKPSKDASQQSQLGSGS